MYIQSFGLQIAVCRNCPEIMYSCTGMSGCIVKAKEKLTFYMLCEVTRNLTNYYNVKKELTKRDVWQFNLIFDEKNKSLVKAEIRESLISV